jgi:hypothetical protein
VTTGGAVIADVLSDTEFKFLAEDIADVAMCCDVSVVVVLVIISLTRDFERPVTGFKLRTCQGRERQQCHNWDEKSIPQHVYLLRWKGDPA